MYYNTGVKEYNFDFFINASFFVLVNLLMLAGIIALGSKQYNMLNFFNEALRLVDGLRVF